MSMKSGRRAFGTTCMICLAFFSASAFAQDNADEPELRNPKVVVTETRSEQAKAYMADIMPKGTVIKRKGLPRWNSELCVSVIGPPVDQGQLIADRISARAMQVGLPAGLPDCDTNLLVVVTNEPEALLPRIVEEHKQVFGDPGDTGIDTAGTSAFSDFARENRPVRWWQVIETFSASGMPIDGDARVGISGSKENVPTVRTAQASRLSSNVRRQISRMVVVVDTRQTAGRSLGAICDYLAFVTLAQVNADADMSAFPSIMNLFNASAETPGSMTDWDVAYLVGTYESKADSVNANSQLREISKLIVKYDPEARLGHP